MDDDITTLIRARNMLRRKDDDMRACNEQSFQKYVDSVEKMQQEMEDCLWNEDLDGYHKAEEEIDNLRSKFITSRLGRFGAEIIQLSHLIKRLSD